MRQVVDLDSNPNQKKFVKEVLKAAYGESAYRVLFFGGGIRGGKTIGCFTPLHIICSRTPGVRAHIIRKSESVLLDTSIPSFRNHFDGMPSIKRWSGSKGDNFVEYKNGSLIFFKSEGFNSDKDLDKFKGFETNIIVLEQVEELQYLTFQKALERVGTWKCGNDRLQPLVLATFNPTFTWVKKRIHDAYVAGTLPEHYYYQTALAEDNRANLHPSLWRNWEGMDEVQYKRFVLGDWEAKPSTNLFLYNFNPNEHVKKCLYDVNLDLWLSFDFNISPMTAILAQRTERGFKVIKEYRMLNADIQKFCNYILADFKQCKYRYLDRLWVCGDPSGSNSSAYLGKNVNYYKIIQENFNVSIRRMVMRKAALSHEASYTHCNTLLSKLHYSEISSDCEYLLHDIYNMTFYALVKQTPLSKLRDADTGQESTIGHLLDCLRYFMDTAYPDVFKIRS